MIEYTDFFSQFVSLTFDTTTGLLSRMTNLRANITTSITQRLMYYESHDGGTEKDPQQASGAYIFRPKTQTPHVISTNSRLVKTNVRC